MQKKVSSAQKAAKTRQKNVPSTRKKSDNNLGLYANLAHKRKTKKDAQTRK